jgi:hypothetical protein
LVPKTCEQATGIQYDVVAVFAENRDLLTSLKDRNGCKRAYPALKFGKSDDAGKNWCTCPPITTTVLCEIRSRSQSALRLKSWGCWFKSAQNEDIRRVLDHGAISVCS